MQQNTAEPFNAASYLVERRLAEGDGAKGAGRGARSSDCAERERAEAEGESAW